MNKQTKINIGVSIVFFCLIVAAILYFTGVFGSNENTNTTPGVPGVPGVPLSTSLTQIVVDSAGSAIAS